MAKKVLIIDDEMDLVDMIHFRLEASGFEVIDAYDGADGIKKSKEEKPDLILLDLMMPQMNGFEVAEKLKEDSALKSIPIIVFTAAVTKDLPKQTREIGAKDCIVKPFDPGDLVERVKKVLA